MTENQEKQMFKILTNLVGSVNAIRSDITEIKSVQAEHSMILKEHSMTLKEHSKMFIQLDSKLESVVFKVIDDSKRIDILERENRNGVQH